jgi:hypothetical protein
MKHRRQYEIMNLKIMTHLWIQIMIQMNFYKEDSSSIYSNLSNSQLSNSQYQIHSYQILR